jgi:hypothetical protein
MRRRFMLGVALLVGLVGTGCPENYGKGGYLDDEMREDIDEARKQRVEEQNTPPGMCPNGKPPRERCEGGICSRRCP